MLTLIAMTLFTAHSKDYKTQKRECLYLCPFFRFGGSSMPIYEKNGQRRPHAYMIYMVCAKAHRNIHHREHLSLPYS